MIRAIAVDDEANALGIIQDYAGRMSEIQLAEQFTNPVKALAYVIGHPEIQLIFLDIRMAKMSGIELTEKLPPNVKVIVTSAYSDYAQMGFELDVVDYLLKPFSFERFGRAVKKAVFLIEAMKETGSKTGVPKMVPGYDDIILVKVGHRTVKFRLNEILYIRGSGNYVTIFTEKQKFLVLNTMKRMEELLMPYQFVRIHKSYIVSFQHIEAIESNAVIVNGTAIPISETMKESFQEFLATHSTQL